MSRARRVTKVLAAVVVVLLVPVVLLGAVQPPRDERLAVGGLTQADLLVVLGLVWAVLVEATLVSAAVWAALSRVRARSWLAACLGLVAVLALVPLGMACVGAVWGAALDGTFSRFDAPDGTQYLLQVKSDGAGGLAVYQNVGFGRWRIVPAFGERDGLPGTIPCHATATSTTIVVRCQGGEPAVSRR